MSENYKYQASFKFGLGQTGMLNVRAETADEFKSQLTVLSTSDILADLSALNATVKALDNIEQAGLQPQVVPQQAAAPAPATTPLQQYQQGIAQSAAQPPTAAPPPAVAAAPLPSCIHGQKTVLSKMKDDGTRWFAYACPAQRNDPTKCQLDFPGFNGQDMPDAHKSAARYL